MPFIVRQTDASKLKHATEDQPPPPVGKCPKDCVYDPVIEIQPAAKGALRCPALLRTEPKTGFTGKAALDWPAGVAIYLAARGGTSLTSKDIDKVGSQVTVYVEGLKEGVANLSMTLSGPQASAKKAEAELNVEAVTIAKVTPDTDDYRQYINFAADASHPEFGRTVRSRTYLKPPLEAMSILIGLKPDGGNKTGLNVSVQNTQYTGATRIDKATDSSGVAESDGMNLSAYGGDVFQIEAETADTPVSKGVSKKITIWRWLKYNNVYTMNGETYIDAATVEAEIQPAYTPAFVRYTRGAVTNVDAGLTVRYIGLFDDSKPGKQKTWPGDFSPAKLESSANELQPTAAELADYAGPDAVKKAAAKTAIEAKAVRWFLKIVIDYNACASAFFAKVGVLPANTLLAVQYYHPKLSGQADGATTFWPAGISINLANPGSGMTISGHPDRATWREVQGFNLGSTSVVFKDYGTAARLQIVCRHEICHATQAAFGRDEFGTGDHSTSGLMTPTGSSDTLSNADLNVLRGFKAP